MGALENHTMEEELRFLSLRAHMACVICQIYIILCAREEGVKGRGKKWISQIRTWKITAESRGEEEQGSNVEYYLVKLRVCEMTSYIIPTPHPWMFDKHLTKWASGAQRRRPGAGLKWHLWWQSVTQEVAGTTAETEEVTVGVNNCHTTTIS